jgi:hypothetical protein
MEDTMSKDKNSFSNVGIGDVLYLEKNLGTLIKMYFFIYDKTPTRIYYSTYEFKNEIGMFSRSDKDETGFKKSLISEASPAIKGDLVKQLLIAKEIKDVNRKS